MRVFLILTLLLIPRIVFGQCVAEIKDVKQDELRGSILIETEYVVNGKNIQLGKMRFLETSGTNAEIIAMAKEEIDLHCENLIKRIDENREYLSSEKLKRQKELTKQIILDIKSELIGYKRTKSESTVEFKGKKINVTYDKKNTTTDIIITP